MNNGDLPKVIADKLKDLEEERETTLRLVPTARDVEAVLAALGLKARPSTYTGAVHPSIMISPSVKTMAEVAEILRALARRGYHQKDKPRDFPDERKRWYVVKNQDGGEVDIWMHFPSQGKCRFVEVGTKTVPVLELRCEDDAPALPAEKPGLAAVFGQGGGA